MGRGTAVAILTVVVAILIISLLAVDGYQMALLRAEAKNSPVTVTKTITAHTGREALKGIESVYDKVKDSVVLVTTLTRETVLTIYGPATVWSRAEGSGFFVEYSGEVYIVTNYHVISGANMISITLLNGTSFKARVVGSDPYSDLAVLGFNFSSGLKPLTMRPSRTLRIGETVIAVGNPFGLKGTLTVGVVSQIGRSISESTVTGYPIADLIQTSAPINPGNSGGPLLDGAGRVVGITTAIVAGAQGVGFAIPSDTIARELPYLVRNGSYNMHPWIGISGMDVDYFMAKRLGLPVTYGILVASVMPGSPAAKAGLRGSERKVNVYGRMVPAGGDVIIGVDGMTVTGIDGLLSYLEENVKPGDTIYLKLVRDGRILEVPLKVGARPPAG